MSSKTRIRVEVIGLTPDKLNPDPLPEEEGCEVTMYLRGTLVSHDGFIINGEDVEGEEQCEYKVLIESDQIFDHREDEDGFPTCSRRFTGLQEMEVNPVIEVVEMTTGDVCFMFREGKFMVDHWYTPS